MTGAIDPLPLRFITAASLFDGHDAAINLIRRLLQAAGAEVIHLGHNRSVNEILHAALEEDADAIAVSSYQGGHMEFFRYLYDELNSVGAGHIRIFGGGGGTFTEAEVAELEAYGIERIYLPEDGMQMGLKNMVQDVLDRTSNASGMRQPFYQLHSCSSHSLTASDKFHIGLSLTQIETGSISTAQLEQYNSIKACPVIGITGTGGAGKSSLTDELINRFCEYLPKMNIAVLAIDPTRRRSGGALLGDRIRINSLRNSNVFMRSMATRRQHRATSKNLSDSLHYLKHCGFDLIFLETAGTGQSDSEIIDLSNKAIYVMTCEYGAASQLEKIDMLDFADFIAINKCEKKGSLDALRDIRKQYKRNHNAFDQADKDLPVYPTIASRFNDPGVNQLFNAICRSLNIKHSMNEDTSPHSLLGQQPVSLIPNERVRYLSEIASLGRTLTAQVKLKTEAISKAQSYYTSLELLQDPDLPEPLYPFTSTDWQIGKNGLLIKLREAYHSSICTITEDERAKLIDWDKQIEKHKHPQYEYKIRDKTIKGENYHTSLSGNAIPKLAVPTFEDWSNRLRFILAENFPGQYPFTMGVFPYRRSEEAPTRMFAGEGTPERTNRRFHYISKGQTTARLSTAFDSVTLYGHDPDPRPDIYGKVGNSGVSIATLDDMKKLYSGFDLCAPTTSVSMTINGPAPIILALFFNAAIDQQIEIYLKNNNLWNKAKVTIKQETAHKHAPFYKGQLPNNHNGLGLALLGISGEKLVDNETYQHIKHKTLQKLRGTVQADILKEDQAQNTCIFSTEFAMSLMGDIQQYFINAKIKNFYSVSISGYHIAEAGANPITQLAFTLANGFTLVEYYLARGMKIDEFAANLSFFFSNGMDAEYAVIGRVARRIWARTMKERYHASESSQKLKYHIQTSGRSLHAQEMDFNDIRTTLQAAYALLDNCNSLHTNAFDEAVTTPTESSVRRALAIQMIINQEFGLNLCENALQGANLINYLTDLVEEAVYKEFDALSERGGVLGAMDTMYQRSKIQEESMLYEHQKHNGELAIIGVNTFKNTSKDENKITNSNLIRASKEEKDHQIEQLSGFKTHHNEIKEQALRDLKQAILSGQNSFSILLETVKVATLEEITSALYEVGGQYRRNM
jgi:methylmalonyl-CoA mutase